MKLEEFTTKYQELSEEQKEDLTKLIQGEQDVIRTEYSKQIKELEKFKPIELTAEQIELAQLKKELTETKFQKSLKDINVKDDLVKYLKSDINIEEFKGFYEQFNTGLKDFVPNSKNMNEIGITKEQFKKMGISDRTKLYESSPELYDQLSK